MGDYRDAFWISGALCLLAATLLVWTRKSVETRKPEMAAVSA
jgi:hypothetical protein